MEVKKQTLALALCAAMAGGAAAQQMRETKQVSGISTAVAEKIQEDPSVRITVDGRPIGFYDVQPVLIDDEIMVPMRGVFEQMGAKVVWNPAQRKVYAERHGIEVALPVGKPMANVNGENKLMDHPPFILNGRTLVPLRFLTYTLGVGLAWHPNEKRVVITSGVGVNDMTPDSQFVASDGKR